MNTRLRRVSPCIAVGIILAASCRTSPHRQALPDSRPPIPAANSQSNTWQVMDPHFEDNTPIRFHFAPPANNFVGEFPRVRGWLRLNPDDLKASASGQFEVGVADITMGEEDLDSNVRNNVEFLQSQTFPISSYVVQGITADRLKLETGAPVPITMRGKFTLKDVEIPLDVRGRLTRIVDPPPERIVLTGSFAIDRLRERFHIAGPGAEDDPAGNQVVIDFTIHLSK